MLASLLLRIIHDHPAAAVESEGDDGDDGGGGGAGGEPGGAPPRARQQRLPPCKPEARGAGEGVVAARPPCPAARPATVSTHVALRSPGTGDLHRDMHPAHSSACCPPPSGTVMLPGLPSKVARVSCPWRGVRCAQREYMRPFTSGWTPHILSVTRGVCPPARWELRAALPSPRHTWSARPACPPPPG